MKVKKLKNCRNCFSIVSNQKYVIATGDRVTVFRREDLSVQCAIPSKILPHAYCCHFLSDDIIMLKNNYAQYMVYDIAQESILWKFKVRGYDSIDRNCLLSSDGKLVFDFLTPSNLEGPDMELIISLEEKCYVLQPLQEPVIHQEGWVRYPATYFAKDATDGVYMAFLIGPPYPDATQKERGLILQHKDRFVGSDYEEIKRWENSETVALGTQGRPNRISYLDSEYVIFEDWQYWNLITQQHGSPPDIQILDNYFSLERKNNLANETSFFLMGEHSVADSVASIVKDFLAGNANRLVRKISLISIPDFQLIETFDHVDGTDDRQICDIEFLDTPNRFLIGTMSGIYLCER